MRLQLRRGRHAQAAPPEWLDELLDVRPIPPASLPALPGVRLNLGCGLHRKQGWINVDADPEVIPDVRKDVATYLRSLGDDVVDEIYAGHLVEHLDHEDARLLVEECRRVLPGGLLGVVVPDTRAIAEAYLSEGRDLDQLCAAFLYSTVQPSQHRWSYDLATLRRLLEEAGLRVLGEIDRFEDARLAGGAWWQAGLDAVKPDDSVRAVSTAT
jgi:predicted SAM-dependent methyltransferase